MSTKFTYSRFRPQPTPKICKKGPRKPGDAPPPPPTDDTAWANVSATRTDGTDVFDNSIYSLTQVGEDVWILDQTIAGIQTIIHASKTAGMNALDIDYESANNPTGTFSARRDAVPVSETPPYDTGLVSLTPDQGTGTAWLRVRAG